MQIGRNSHVQSRNDDEKFLIAIFFVMHDDAAFLASLLLGVQTETFEIETYDC